MYNWSPQEIDALAALLLLLLLVLIVIFEFKIGVIPGGLILACMAATPLLALVASNDEHKRGGLHLSFGLGD